ncbi:MAG: precorrin-8X methylmutase [Cyanobacteria bacterium J06659_2]
MPPLSQHAIVHQSFAVIDREIGAHELTPKAYAVVRRVIHSTADFEFKHLIRFSPGAIAAGMNALRQQVPIITDVTMVQQGIQGMVERTFQNPLIAAIAQEIEPQPGKTRTELGMLKSLAQYPQAIVVIGNAPTALLALCDAIAAGQAHPSLVIGAPVGFIAVEDSKRALAQTAVPQIRVDGRKGGSGVAAAMLNALTVLAWEALP